MNIQELIGFEKDIASLFEQGKIRAPVHLASGNEFPLIEIFREIKPEDFIFTSWRSHLQSLLHGMPPELLKEKILDGQSITIMSSKYRVFSSAIVGSICPIALGMALGGQKTFVFCGDMTAETGSFYEAVKYATNKNLPITFIIEDNGISTTTPTQDAWLGKFDWGPWSMPSEAGVVKSQKWPIWYYRYKLTYPHQGIGKWIQF